MFILLLFMRVGLRVRFCIGVGDIGSFYCSGGEKIEIKNYYIR